MSDSASFRLDNADAPAAIGLVSLFAGVDGLVRAAAVVAGGSFALGMVIVLLASAA